MVMNITRVAVGQVDVVPGTVKMWTTDDYATITAPGYINNSASSTPILPSDVIEVMYEYDQITGAGIFDVFTPSFTDGVITLVEWVPPSQVTLPVTSGHLASFDGTDGTIKDSTIASNKVMTSTISNPLMYWSGHTVTAGEQTAGEVVLDTGTTNPIGFSSVQIRVSGGSSVIKYGNYVVTNNIPSNGLITIANGASDNLATGNIINWLAIMTV